MVITNQHVSICPVCPKTESILALAGPAKTTWGINYLTRPRKNVRHGGIGYTYGATWQFVPSLGKQQIVITYPY